MKIARLLPALALASTLSFPLPAAESPAFGLRSAEECRKCHVEVYEEWRHSPLAHFSRAENLPLDRLWAAREEVAGKKLTGCEMCHEPVRRFGKAAIDPDNGWIARERITCDFCHSVRIDHGKDAFVLDRTGAKLGTNREASSKKHPVAFSEDHARADLCLQCHRNIRAEYQEFKTKFPERSLTCQQCHMPPRENGSGHHHTFVGGFSEAMLQQAVRMDLTATKGAPGVQLEIRACPKFGGFV
jgi:hypothetical protein